MAVYTENQSVVILCGSTGAITGDPAGDEAIDYLYIPEASCRLYDMTCNQVAAASGGTVTGTEAITLEEGLSTAGVAISAAIAAADADAAAGTIHGTALGLGTNCTLAKGTQTQLMMTTTGTVQNTSNTMNIGVIARFII